MAMATQGLADQDQPHQLSEPSTNSSSTSHHGAAAASSIATNRWGPYSGAGDFASNMAVILAALLAALALGLALSAAVRYLLRRARRRRAGSGDRQGNSSRSSGSGVLVEDPEKPPVELEARPPPPPALVYSAAGTKLAGAAAECAICLAEFADGDAVRVMPACRHGFHARCIERWLAGGRRSSCPTCRAPAAVVAVADESATPTPSLSS